MPGHMCKSFGHAAARWVTMSGSSSDAMQAYVRQLTKAAAGAESSAEGGAAAALGQIAMHCMQVGCLQ